MISSIEDGNIIFFDEKELYHHSYQNNRYSPKNTKLFINLLNSKGTNISILCAITILGVLCYKFKVSSFLSVDVIEFINTQLPILQANVIKFLIMGNASIHRTAEVKETTHKKGYILMFLFFYTP